LGETAVAKQFGRSAMKAYRAVAQRCGGEWKPSSAVKMAGKRVKERQAVKQKRRAPADEVLGGYWERRWVWWMVDGGLLGGWTVG
jgi:hypothetical protein